jgi:pimeloyl-ACP methyl ester carboxylesterase
MRQLVIVLAVVLTGAYAWAQEGVVEGHAQGDDMRLAFVQAGAGPLIVFLHGHPDSWTLYDAQLREFSRDHLHNVRTDLAQNRASQYERDYNAALPPYPVWYNYYRACRSDQDTSHAGRSGGDGDA